MITITKGAHRVMVCAVAIGFVAALAAPRLFAWGELGHRITGQAAAAALPAAMPTFFRNAAAQLAYLNPEPDRWRDHAEHDLDPALDVAAAGDHFIDLELLPAERRARILGATTRYAYIDSLRTIGVDGLKAGFLPFRILELTQRLRVEFRLWRTAGDSTRLAIEARIINDAGILGHYVADGSNPAHTSVQYNGWTGANPNGYATDRQFHARFESDYVQAFVSLADVKPIVDTSVARVVPNVRAAVIAYLTRSNGEVERMYQIDKTAHFCRQGSTAEGKRFVVDRLAAGAEMLRDLWWTAWMTSGT
jgi:hypothetical protein